MIPDELEFGNITSSDCMDGSIDGDHLLLPTVLELGEDALHVGQPLNMSMDGRSYIYLMDLEHFCCLTATKIGNRVVLELARMNIGHSITSYNVSSTWRRRKPKIEVWPLQPQAFNLVLQRCRGWRRL